MADGAPPEHRHADLGGGQAEPAVGDGIGQMLRTLDRLGVDAVLHEDRLQRPARVHRLADDVVLPADDAALAVEPGPQGMDVGRPVAPAFHVVLAGPLHLHRHAGPERARRRDRFHDNVAVIGRAAAEAAASLHDVHADLVRRDAGNLRRDGLVEPGHLVPAPDLDRPVFVHPRHRVERLERGLGEIGELVARLDDLRGPGERRGGVALVDRHRHGRAGGELAVLRHDLVGAPRLGIGLVPLHGDRVPRLPAPPTCARRPPRSRAGSAPRRRRPASPSPPPRRRRPLSRRTSADGS